MLSRVGHPMTYDDGVSSGEALAGARKRREEAQARWPVIAPLVASLREIREANHLAERFRATFLEKDQ